MVGDVRAKLAELPEESVHCVVTSPPYWGLRDYGVDGQEPYPHSHFATFPTALVKPCVLAGCPVGGVVLDPFAGSGTAGEVALELGRRALLIELNPDYVPLIERRLAGVQYPLPLGVAGT
jgi:DNA modification methylase